MNVSMVKRLVRQLEQRGLTIEPGEKPGDLLLCGPKNEKTPGIVAAVKAFKPQLLEMYGTRAKPDFGPDDGARPDVIAQPEPEPP